MAAGSLRKLDLGLDQRSAVFFFMAAVVCCESIKLHLTRRPWNLVVFNCWKKWIECGILNQPEQAARNLLNRRNFSSLTNNRIGNLHGRWRLVSRTGRERRRYSGDGTAAFVAGGRTEFWGPKRQRFISRKRHEAPSEASQSMREMDFASQMNDI